MDQKQTSILLVDDDVNLRQIYAEAFEKAGFAVSEADDGLMALELITKNPPGIVFTGIMMPRMDGFAMIEQLQKNIQTKAIPIFVFSHLGRQEDLQKAQSLGVRRFFIKGIDSPRAIIAEIKNIVAAHSALRVVVDGDQLDGAKLQQLIGNKESIILELQQNLDADTMSFVARIVKDKE